MDQNNDYNNSSWVPGQPGMNLPYNGNPETFKANVIVEQPGMYFQSMDTSNIQKPKKKRKTSVIVSIFLVVLIAVGVGLYFVFLTPEKRFARHLDNGREAMEAEDYELALEEYEKALDIDDESITAMRGALDACLMDNDEAYIRELYEKYIYAISEMDSELVEANVDDVTYIYAMAKTVYPDDESYIQVLEEGLTVLGESDEISALLLEGYMDSAALKLEEEDYSAALVRYNLASYVTSDNADIDEGRKICVEKLLNGYIISGEFDTAEAMISEYQDQLDNVNFTEYSQRIENYKNLSAAGAELLSGVYECITTGNYDELINYDNSQNASTVNNMMTSGCYVYAEDGFTSDYTGTATGLYGLDFGGYYFYCGEYKDGKRSGDGIYYLLTDIDNNTYDIFEGEWENDKPNGAGTLTTYNELSDGELITTSISGTYTDGCEDGDFTATLTSDAGYTITGDWTASMGAAEDIREQYPQYDWSGISTERIVYALLKDESDSTRWYFSIGVDGILKLSPF